MSSHHSSFGLPPLPPSSRATSASSVAFPTRTPVSRPASGQSRQASEISVTYELSARNARDRTVIIGPEPPTPERTYQRKFTPSPLPFEFSTDDLQRYLPYAYNDVHYKLEDLGAIQRYSVFPIAAARISLMHEEGGRHNETRRTLRQIARTIYQKPVPPVEHMQYLVPKHELRVNEEMELLDELCTFRPENIVLKDGKVSVLVTSHNEHPEYYDLINHLSNRRAQASKEVKAAGPRVPEWPLLPCSFDLKQFTAAAVLFRDEVTRFLAYYVRKEANSPFSSPPESISFEGFSASRIIRSGSVGPSHTVAPRFTTPVQSPSLRMSRQGLEYVPGGSRSSVLPSQAIPSIDQENPFLDVPDPDDTIRMSSAMTPSPVAPSTYATSETFATQPTVSEPTYAMNVLQGLREVLRDSGMPIRSQPETEEGSSLPDLPPHSIPGSYHHSPELPALSSVAPGPSSPSAYSPQLQPMGMYVSGPINSDISEAEEDEMDEDHVQDYTDLVPDQEQPMSVQSPGGQVHRLIVEERRLSETALSTRTSTPESQRVSTQSASSSEPLPLGNATRSTWAERFRSSSPHPNTFVQQTSRSPSLIPVPENEENERPDSAGYHSAGSNMVRTKRNPPVTMEEEREDQSYRDQTYHHAESSHSQAPYSRIDQLRNVQTTRGRPSYQPQAPPAMESILENRTFHRAPEPVASSTPVAPPPAPTQYQWHEEPLEGIPGGITLTQRAQPRPRASAIGVPAHLNRMAEQGTGIQEMMGPRAPLVPSAPPTQGLFGAPSMGNPPPPGGSSPDGGSFRTHTTRGAGSHRSRHSQREAPPHAAPNPGDPDEPDGPGGGGSNGNSPPPTPRRRRSPSPDANANRAPRPWGGPLPLHVDAKLKLNDLPEFSGNDDDIIPYFAKTNGLADQSVHIQAQLGQLLPLRFKDRAFNWYHTMPLLDRTMITQSWDTLKAALMAHFMNAVWCAKERTRASRMRFRDSGHSDELPVDYVMRKKMHLTLLQRMPFDQLIHEIIIGAPEGWETILRVDDLQGQWSEFVNRVHQHSRALSEARSGSTLLKRIERLEQGKSHTRSHFTKPAFKKDKKGKFKAHTREAKVGDRRDLPKPNFNSAKFTPKVKLRPSQKNARPCIHCNGDHWDDECKKQRSNQPFVRSNLAATDSDGLAAQQEYEDLYCELSSAESSDTESESDDEQEEDQSDESEQDFRSPSNVLSATTSSVKPVAETEESQDVLEGNTSGQTTSSLVTVNTVNSHFISAPSIASRIPSRRSLAKQLKLQSSRSYQAKGYTPVGPKMVLRRIMSRPPGTAYLGTTASIALGQLGNHCTPFPITFDSGSDITLISLAKYNSLDPKPAKRKGRNITIIQVTGQSSVNEYITVPLIFSTPEGPVEMLVEAYIVKDMTTPFILGNDFGNQYQLSLLRVKDGVFIGLGNTNRRVSVVPSPSEPRADSQGNVFEVKVHRVQTHLEDKAKQRAKAKEVKALRAAPEGSIPVRLYDTKTISPNSIALVRVKTTFAIGQFGGYVERLMGSNRTEEDLFGITDCIIDSDNPKLQIANFSDQPVKLQAGRIIGYMRPTNVLAKESDLGETEKEELMTKVNLIRSLERKEPAVDEGLDMAYSVAPEGGPKLWDNPGPEVIPREQLLSEVDFNPQLQPNEKSQLERIVIRHHMAFGLDGRLGTHDAQVPIRLKDEKAPPISMAPYAAPPAKKEAIDKQIDDWLRLEVIEESSSPWGFPVIVVYWDEKSKARVCIDYRKLNDRAVSDEYPLPRQTDILNALQGSQYLTTLDALAGFTQLSVEEADRPKTAFRCHRGLFQFNRLPFGFKNGPAAFQRVMQKVLAPFLWLFALVYIDDIVVFSKSFNEHCSHLNQVFRAIVQSNITLSPKKCHIGYQSLLLLGHKVSRLGVSTHKEKVDAIVGMAPPANRKQLQTFLGKVVYFMSMIPFGAWLAAPLFSLLKKEAAWAWGEAEQKAFDLLKQALTSAPILAYPDTSLPFRVYTDASEIGLSGIVNQIQMCEIGWFQNTAVHDVFRKAFEAGQPIPRVVKPLPKDAHIVAGGNKEWDSMDWQKTIVPMERTCAYWSRILKKEERNYSATEREGLALKETLIKFQAILEGAEITAILDHYALAFINTFSYIKTNLAKMSLFYHSYPGLSITHRAGRVHDNADALSRYMFRLPKTQNPVTEDYDPIILKDEEDGIKDFYAETEHLFKEKVQEVVAHQVLASLKDQPDIGEIYQTQVRGEDSFVQDYDAPTSYNVLVSISSEETNMFLDAYTKDPHYSKVLSALKGEYHPLNSPFPQYEVGENGLLYFSGAEGNLRLCVPKDLQNKILEEGHSSVIEGAHAGYARTYNRIRSTYYWPQMAKTIERYIVTCDLCQKNKPRRHGKQGYLQPIPIPEQPFEVVSLDFIMDLPDSNGYNAILVLVDKLTRYAHFVPCTTRINEVETAQLFRDHIWAQYGLPRQIISDRDSRWTGAFWDHLTSLLGIQRALTTAHHPQADGQTEIMNQTLEVVLRSYIDDVKSNWSQLLPAIAFSYNTSIHSTTKQTPAFLLRGYEPLRPSHLRANISHHVPRIESEVAEQFAEEMLAARNKAKDAIRIGQVYQQNAYNNSRHFAQYSQGDLVLINLKSLDLMRKEGKGKKLSQLYDGPFEIMDQISPVTYRLRLPDNYPIHPVINIAHLESYRRSPAEFGKRLTKPLKRDLIDDDQVYEVEQVVDEGFTRERGRRVKKYRIRWKGYGPEEDEWLSAKRLRNAPDVIKDWEATKKESRDSHIRI